MLSTPRYYAGECPGLYNVEFTVVDAPSSPVIINYTWHLADGETVTEKPITLAVGASQSVSYAERHNGTTNGTVYLTWTADGKRGESNSASVELICIS